MNSQLKMLLSDISGHSSRHLKEIQSDLVQTNMLLDEAITQLTESFEGITKGVGTYQKAIVNLLPSEAMEQSPDRLQNIVRLNAVNEILAFHINAAVTRLQFEDITSQLIRRAARRVDGLREMLECLGNAALEELEDEVERGVKVDLLEQMLVDIRVKSKLIDDQLRKAVAQRRMDCGEMELF